MAKFDQNTLKHLSKLCRIDIDPEDEADIVNSLSRILSYVEQLNEVDTKDVMPCNYVLRSMLKNQMRKDEVKDIMPREELLANAPDQIGGMIRVPPVLKAR